MTEYDEKKYPMIWKKVSRRGYCFTARIPCRIIERTGKRIRIAALLAMGGEKITVVDQKSLEHDPCHCFSECRAFERLDKKAAAIPGTGLDRGTGQHKYPGSEAMLKTGKLEDFFTSDCAYGCGCWMGGSRSGGPAGVDPFGACPKAPVEAPPAGK